MVIGQSICCSLLCHLKVKRRILLESVMIFIVRETYTGKKLKFDESLLAYTQATKNVYQNQAWVLGFYCTETREYIIVWVLIFKEVIYPIIIWKIRIQIKKLY